MQFISSSSVFFQRLSAFPVAAAAVKVASLYYSRHTGNLSRLESRVINPEKELKVHTSQYWSTDALHRDALGGGGDYFFQYKTCPNLSKIAQTFASESNTFVFYPMSFLGFFGVGGLVPQKCL